MMATAVGQVYWSISVREVAGSGSLLAFQRSDTHFIRKHRLSRVRSIIRCQLANLASRGWPDETTDPRGSFTAATRLRVGVDRRVSTVILGQDVVHVVASVRSSITRRRHHIGPGVSRPSSNSTRRTALARSCTAEGRLADVDGRTALRVTLLE